MSAGELTRDPSRGAVEVGDLAVERHGGLQRDVRSALAHRGQENAVLALRVRGRHARDDLDSRALELGEAPPRDEGVRIPDGHDHARDARRSDRGDAWGRPPLMGARFERHVERPAARSRPGRT